MGSTAPVAKFAVTRVANLSQCACRSTATRSMDGEMQRGPNMAWFEIVYSKEPTGKALSSEKVVARDRSEATATAAKGFAAARATHGADCYRVLDGGGMVVARGPIRPSGMAST
jgi:hypothetical protein